jgi:plastocyanin
MRTRTLTAAGAAVVLALAFTACGDDDDDDAGGDDTTEETAAPADDAEGGEEESGGSGGGAGDVTIVNFAFTPEELTVASGDSVAVSNEDSTTHTFTSDDGGFDLSLAGGESGEVEVTAEAGEYEFHCTIHPSMTGTITVE